MARARGSQRIAWRQPRYLFTDEGDSCTVEATGLYSALLSQRPQVGKKFSRVSGNFTITSVLVEPGRATEGKMIVSLEGGQSAERPEEELPIYERDNGVISRPIEMHPKFGGLKENRPYYPNPEKAHHPTANPRYNDPANAEDSEGNPVQVAQRTLDNWAVLDEQDWRASTGWSLAQYKELREAGRTTYEVPFPIARATTYHTKAPDGSAINEKDNPPSQCGVPGGWTYYIASDAAVREGKRWRRTRVWHGRVDDGTEALLY